MSRVRPLLLLVAFAGFAPTSRAAIAPWPMGGCLAADPAGVQDLPVTRQRLTVDLGPALDGGPAGVTVVYDLAVAGPPVGVPIWVKASARAGAPRVLLDNRPVDVRPGEPPARPQWWGWPSDAAHRSSLDSKFFTALLDLTPGPHTLELRYEVELYTRHTREPTKIHDFEYHFAPATDRPGRPVEVTVHVPPGWSVVRSPDPLDRAGDVLTGRYDAPPPELSVAIQMPPPEESDVGLVGYLAAMLGGGFVCLLFGWVLGRAGVRPWLLGLLAGMVYGGAVFGVALLGLASQTGIPEAQQSRNHDQFRLDLILPVAAAVVSAVLVPVGLALTALGAWIGSLRSDRTPRGR